MQEEPFGPVAPIATFEDFDEVVARANGVPFGLRRIRFITLARKSEDATAVGSDVLLRIRSEGRSVPVTIVTGFDQPGLRQKCLDAGASDYLVKPLEASAVSTAIRVAMG